MRMASLIINLALLKDIGKTAALANESSVLLTFANDSSCIPTEALIY